MLDNLVKVYENLPNRDPEYLEELEDYEQVDLEHRLEKKYITCLKCSNIALNPMQC